jgi:hypothetical protein
MKDLLRAASAASQETNTTDSIAIVAWTPRATQRQVGTGYRLRSFNAWIAAITMSL